MGGVGEWLIPADCKSAAERLRRFESYPRHKTNSRHLSSSFGRDVTYWSPLKGPHSSVVEHVLGKNGVASSNLAVGLS